MSGYWVVEVGAGEAQEVAEVGCVEAQAGCEVGDGKGGGG